MGIFAKLVILSSNTKHFIVIDFAENVFYFVFGEEVACISSVCIPATGHRCDCIFRRYLYRYEGIAITIMGEVVAG